MTRTQTAFDGLLSQYFEQLLEDRPMYATVQGIEAAEGKLGNSSPDFIQKRERERQDCLRRLESINPRELNAEQHLDRLALRSLLLKECEDHARRRHEVEPNAAEQLLSILLYELLRSDDEPRRAARNLRRLLRQAPDWLRQAALILKAPEHVWL